SIAYSQEATINALFNLIRAKHPAFAASGPRAEDLTKIMRAMGQVMDVLNPIRNQASVAHPNPQLLEGAEAMLVINVTRSMLHYLKAKLAGIKNKGPSRDNAAGALRHSVSCFFSGGRFSRSTTARTAITTAATPLRIVAARTSISNIRASGCRLPSIRGV